MKCPGCEKVEIEERLQAGDVFCRECGSDWSPYADALLLPKVLFNEGLSAAKIGDLDRAEQRLMASVQLDPGGVAAWVVLGKVLGQQDRLVQATSAWKRAAKLDPNNEAARAGIAWAREKLRSQVAQPEPELDPVASLTFSGNVTVKGKGWSATASRLTYRTDGAEQNVAGSPVAKPMGGCVADGDRRTLRVPDVEISADKVSEPRRRSGKTKGAAS